MAYYEIQNVYLEHINENDLNTLLLNDNKIDDFYFILHNKDLNSMGEFKKPHFHLCVSINIGVKHNENETYLKGLFSFTKPRIKCIRSIEKFLRYLTHRDNKEKYQYCDSDVYAKDKENYFNLIENKYTSSNSDILVDEYCCYIENYLLYSKDLEVPQNIIFNFFRKVGKLNYYLSHINQINDLTTFLVSAYHINKNGGD